MMARWRPSISQVLFATLLAISITIAAAITFYWRHAAHEDSLAAADRLMVATAQNIRLREDTLVDPIVSIVGLLPHWSGDSIAPGPNGSALRARFIAVFGELPQINDIFIGTNGGDYYRISALHRHAGAAPDRALPGSIGAAPQGAAFIERVMLRDGRLRPLGIDRYLDADGVALRTVQHEDTGFDPRLWPWFTGAGTTDHVYRSPMTHLADTHDPGVSFSHAYPDGVLGMDITLAELGHFFDTLPQAGTGVVALLDRSGRVLTRSSVERSAAPLDEAGLNRLAAESEADDRTRTITLAGTPWLVHRSAISLGADEGETLLVAMPLATLTASIDESSGDALLVTVLILLAAVPVLWMFSRMLSRPLKRLALSADAIRRFEIDAQDDVSSRISEIERLERAMAEMRSSLRTFAVYVPKTLVKQLLEQAGTPSLGGRRRDITVLFMDIENFTAMSADLEPEEVMRRMSRYFEAVTATLLAHDATIDKYIGDAVMAFWNAPADTTEHTLKACAAALEIAEVARRETETWGAGSLPPLRTRIGLHTGEAIVGNVGSSDRMNYTALGATVNLAARLESLNRDFHTDILVSQSIVDRVGDAGAGFRFVPAGETTLRGFTGPVSIYELRRAG